MNNITIDSLKVRIPYNEVEILNQTIFSDKMVIDADTSQIEKEFKQKRYTHKYDGITTSFGVEDQVSKTKKVKTYLVVLFNSKLLHEDYLDGITANNIRLIYDRIMGFGLIRFSYESFIFSMSTDVDFKSDAYVEHFDKSVNTIYRSAKPSKNRGSGCNAFTKPTNKGIEFGKRETANASHPFLKIYHKGLELLNKSSYFYNKYLKSSLDNVINLVRLEFTIKNKKHFKTFGIEETTLKSILSIEQSALEVMAKSIMAKHLEPRITPIRTPKDMTPANKIQFNAISLLMQSGYNYNLIRESLIQSMSTVDKSRYRSKLDGIYESAIKGNEEDSISQKQSKFFDSIGWF